jgi:hypothetical protein
MATAVAVRRQPNRLRQLAPVLIGAVLACGYLAFTPKTGDLAAQSFRVSALVRSGLTPWNNYWYAGHHLPGYSMLFPIFGSIVSAPVAGTIAAFLAVVVFARVVQTSTEHATLPTVLFAIGLAANLVSGRLTFVLGIALGVAAIWAATRRWTLAWALAAAVFAGVSALASPVAGAFVAMAGVAILLAHRRDAGARRVGIALAASPIVVIALLTHWFPEGGDFPFPWWVLVQVLVAAGLCVALLRTDARALRIGAALYFVACVVAFFVPSPMGANAARLGALLAAPLLVAFSGSRRRWLLLAALAFVLIWQWEAPIRDLALASNDPSVDQAYYQPLLHHLDSMHFEDAPFRIEIPSTANHWEADYVGLHYPIARGWDRQLDRKYNEILYDSNLTGAQYLEWLRHEGVQYVAVPKLPTDLFDAGARAELALVARGLPDLVPVWRSENWTFYRVRAATGLASGAGRLSNLTLSSFDVHFDAPGTALVRTHWSPNFEVTRGTACIAPSSDGWTTVVGRSAGTVRVEATFVLGAITAGTPTCPAQP